MNYTLKSSLEGRALVKVNFVLWLHDVDSLLKFALPGNNEMRIEWHEVEGNVLKRVSKLRLPAVLIRKLSDLIEPMGRHILMWKDYHEKLLNINFCKEILSKLCWTPYGTVDNKKTAEFLIKERSLDTYHCYKLACTYCIELDIRRLKKQLDQVHFEFPGNESNLVSFWNGFLRGDMAYSCYDDFPGPNCYENAFHDSAISGNEAATRYFFEKIALRKRANILERFVAYSIFKRSTISQDSTDFPKELYTSVLCFLLSCQSKEHQLNMFECYPRRLLKCLLDWPWQEFFLETAKYMETLFSEEDFYYLLTEIADKVVGNYIDHKYQEIFETFWQQRTVSYKKYVIKKCAVNGHLLLSLLRAGDKKNVELILKDASDTQKENLISSCTGKSTCDSLIGDHWDSLKFFICACISSEDAAKKFTKEMKVYISRCTSDKAAIVKLCMWKKVFNLLSEIAKNCKRKNGEDDGNAAKKVCEMATCSKE